MAMKPAKIAGLAGGESIVVRWAELKEMGTAVLFTKPAFSYIFGALDVHYFSKGTRTSYQQLTDLLLNRLLLNKSFIEQIIGMCASVR